MKMVYRMLMLTIIAVTGVQAQEMTKSSAYPYLSDDELAQLSDPPSWWAPGYGVWTGTAANYNVFNNRTNDAARQTQDTRLGIYPGNGTCTSQGGCVPPAGY